MKKAGGLLLAVALSCKSVAPLPELSGGIEIGLKRGSAWSTYTLRPPHLIGARGNLRIQKGRFSGAVAGVQTVIETTEEGLTGQAGCPIELDIDGTPEELEVSGIWNGARVRFTITPESIRGTMGGAPLSGGGSSGAGRFDGSSNGLLDGRVTNVGKCPRSTQCQYVLDKIDEEGVRSGVSICSGLPEDTVLEFPRNIQGWLSRNEAVAVLLVLLSSPPTTSMETGPRTYE